MIDDCFVGVQWGCTPIGDWCSETNSIFMFEVLYLSAHVLGCLRDFMDVGREGSVVRNLPVVTILIMSGWLVRWGMRGVSIIACGRVSIHGKLYFVCIGNEIA